MSRADSNPRTRLIVHESEGRLATGETVGSTGTTRRAGITVTVHDTHLLYEVVGLFRSEEQEPNGRATRWQVRRLFARRKARELCDRLNAEYE